MMRDASPKDDMNMTIHSNQGMYHYMNIHYQELLKENGQLQSMSRRKNC